MVNHARTLLLNIDAASLESIGFSRGEPWIVDPTFVPSVPEPCVDKVLSSMGGGSASPSDRDGILRLSGVVTEVFRMAASPDCRGLFEWLDWREVPMPPSSGTIGGVVSRRSFSDSTCGVANAMADSASASLFSPTGMGAVDKVLLAAYPLFTSPFEWTVRFSAVVAAVLARLEGRRVGGHLVPKG